MTLNITFNRFEKRDDLLNTYKVMKKVFKANFLDDFEGVMKIKVPNLERICVEFK